MIDPRVVGKWWVARVTYHGNEVHTTAVKQDSPIEQITVMGYTAHKASDDRESDWLSIDPSYFDIEGKLHLTTKDLPFTADYFDHDGIYEVDVLESGYWYIND